MPDIPDEAVKAATAAYASALYDRVTPMVCTDEALMRIVLEAAVPFLGGKEDGGGGA